MKFRSYLIGVLFLPLVLSSCRRPAGEEPDRISFTTEIENKRVDVKINGELFTSFCWPDSVYKPVLYPILTSSGTEITRGFPLKPREGERNDHIHQTGLWLNYGNVNGIDFWGNGSRGFQEPGGGVIRHSSIERISSKKGNAVLVSLEKWVDASEKIILEERTEYHILSRGTIRIIDRISNLEASDTSVLFSDTKEGMFAIRVARQLELPSREAVVLLDNRGKPAEVKDSLNRGVTGNYKSSEGITGEAVWGKRARWMELSGIIENENISIVICDHPQNPGYPTYWHARGYGLFSANPFGWKDFTSGKETFNFKIPSGKSTKLKYRVIIKSGKLTATQIDSLWNDFRKSYRKK